MEEHIKITELRCPSCGGILKLPDENVKSVQCEYCGNEYVFERPQQKFTPRIGPDWEPVAPQPTIQTNTLNNIWICVALFLFGIIGIVAVGRYQRTQRIKNIVLEPVPINETFHSFGENEQEEGTLSGALEQMVSVVFGKDAESVTEEELSQIQWIADKSDLDYYYIGYSFENPLENPDAKLNWLTFAAQSESGYNGLSQFRGLKRLDTKKSLSQCNLQGLQIKSLSAPIKSLEEAAEELENPELITQLTIGSQIENLQGLERFPNVQQLIINASVLNDIDAVIVLNQLKSLTLNNADVMTNFDVLASINTLEELVIESENLKALDFLKRMPQLRSLGLKDGAFLDLRELETLVELEKLAIEDCDELTDMSNVTKLLELKELLLDLPFGCAEPSLGELTKLQRLTLKKFDSCDFLSKLVNLETLTLHNCTLSSNLNLSGLTQLRKLTCASYSGDMPLNFINSLSTLEEVDLGGMVTYKDISGILRCHY